MGLNKEQVYSTVQSIFRPGLVMVVGSGASSALGLPGMGKLAEHLNENIPKKICENKLSFGSHWEPIAESLNEGHGLEEALGDGVESDDLSTLISEQISDCILESEHTAISEILGSRPPKAFSRIFHKLLRSGSYSSIDVITTNYDRLLEAQAARADVGIDSMFHGSTIGTFDPSESSRAMRRYVQQTGRRQNLRRTQFPHIRLSKPHGSLDWITYNGKHFRTDLPIRGARSIVSPGKDKIRQGYDLPFDNQRERANQAIDQASALLFVGYGFNDDHLQTHIKEKIKDVPSLILSRNITENGREYLSSSSFALGIESIPNDSSRSRALTREHTIDVDRKIWDLDTLSWEVLNI